MREGDGAVVEADASPRRPVEARGEEEVAIGIYACGETMMHATRAPAM